MACVRTCIPCALHKAPLAWFLMAPWDVSKLLLCSRMHPLSRMGCVNAGGREHPLSPLSLLGGCTGSGAGGFVTLPTQQALCVPEKSGDWRQPHQWGRASCAS